MIAFASAYDVATLNPVATYWKNGAATNLTDGTSFAVAGAITIDSSGNVYVAGNTTNVSANGTSPNTATYWKNGTATTLTDGSSNAVVYGMALSSQ